MGIAEDVIDFLFDGMVEPSDLISKMNPDGSSMHVDKPLSAKIKQKKKAWDEKSTGQKVAIATNTAGAIAGPAAIWQATKSRKSGGVPRDILRSVGGQRGKRIAAALDKPMTPKQRAAAMGAGAGMIGLQVANWAGDTIAAKEMSKPKNQLIDEAVERSKIQKYVYDAVVSGVPPEEVMEIISKIRRPPVSSAPVRRAATTPIQAIKNGQRLIGFAAAGGVGGTGYLLGRRRTAQSVDEAVDERMAERSLMARMKPKAPTGKVAGEVPVVIESKYTPKKDTVGKSDDADIEWVGEISKVDEDKRHVFGWCSLSKVNGEDVVDKQDDYIPIDETEKAAYNYVLHSRKGGDMHRRDGEQPLHTSDMIESMVFTDDKVRELGLPDDFPRGWWTGFKINDDNLWQEVKDGKKVHFSVHGRGRRVPREA